MRNLSWLTDDSPVAGVTVSEDDYVFWSPVPGTPPVRLTFIGGQLNVDGVNEHREDFTSLIGAIDELREADLGPGEVAFIGDWPGYLPPSN